MAYSLYEKQDGYVSTNNLQSGTNTTVPAVLHSQIKNMRITFFIYMIIGNGVFTYGSVPNTTLCMILHVF